MAASHVPGVRGLWILPRSPASLPPPPEEAVSERDDYHTHPVPFDSTFMIRKLSQGWRSWCPKQEHLKPDFTTVKLTLSLPQGKHQGPIHGMQGTH